MIKKTVWGLGLLLWAALCPLAPGDMVQGVEMFHDYKEIPIAKTDRPEDFNAEVAGHDLTVSFFGIPAGKVTIEIDEAETYFESPEKRVMALTANGMILQPKLDIFQEAGFATALPKQFPFDHAGGRLMIELIGINNLAKFGAIRILDSTGQVLGKINARNSSKIKKENWDVSFRLHDENDLIYFNVDHSPVGAYAGLLYGARGTRGGFEMMEGAVPAQGIIIGLEDAGRFNLLPFLEEGLVSDKAEYVADGAVQRKVRACTDAWTVPGLGLGWTHLSPSWYMASIDTANDAEKRRFALPATWMVFNVDNRTGTAPKILYFGLPVSGIRKSFADGKYEGFTVGDHALAVKAGSCELLEGNALKQVCPHLDAGFVFRLVVPPGTSQVLPVIVAHYHDGVVAKQLNAKFYYTTLFSSIDDVIAYAGAHLAEAMERSQKLDGVLDASGQNAYRKFLAGHALHSYRYNTVLLATPDGKPVWSEQEGGYANTNTFDLTVDHLFYDAAMHPWVVRNVLDRFADSYHLTLPLFDPATKTPGPPGLFFNHDMGQSAKGQVIFNSPGQPSSYEKWSGFMGQEQLQNWILCAGVCWKKSGDDAWLKSREPTLKTCLQSMLLRDNPDPAKRDGITKFINLNPSGGQEITTYDSLDHSLCPSCRNGYIAMKSWGAYLALESMFLSLGDKADAATARHQADLTAASVIAHWKKDEGYLPAVFDGKTTARILPIVEGLVYPYEMGLTKETAPDGPYADLIKVLHNHVDNALQPGTCLDSVTGAWKLSSSSQNTWQSKVYLAQFVVENILGIKDDRVDGKVDQIHASFQVCGAASQAWSDQLNSATSQVFGSTHYPRGVTSALWWLDTKNAEAGQNTAIKNPAASTPQPSHL